jgi:hypothetical protein
MSTNTPPNWGGSSIGQRLDEALERIQLELRQAAAYVNDAVIPQVRRESIQGLRTASDALRNLADRFERQSNASGANQSQGGPNQTPGEPHS